MTYVKQDLIVDFNTFHVFQLEQQLADKNRLTMWVCTWNFSFQPVLHSWYNKGCGMCYPVCGMVHIKEPLLLIRKSSLCGSSGFPFSLLKWSLTICLTPYNRKKNVLSVSLNKTFPSFLCVHGKCLHCKAEQSKYFLQTA